MNLHHNVSRSHPLYPFLSHETNQLQSHLDRIKPRVKRSLNFIGSAWKWIAGNPDHDDFEIIKQKMNNVLQNNNRQVIVNKLSIQNLDDLTKTTNQIVKYIKSHEIVNESLISTLKYKIDILKEELLSIQYAIHWAKAGIVNSFILTNNEVNIVKQIFEKDAIPYINLEEAFEFSEVKIASSNNLLIYIVSIPTTAINSCNSLLIKPTKFGKFVNKILYDKVLICNNSTFGIKNPCKSYNKLTICSINNLENINNDTCITNLLRSRTSNCTLVNNNYMPTVEEIGPGILLLNQFNDTVYINDEPRNLSGTYILQYHNASIIVENKTYNYFQMMDVQPLPPVLQPRSPGSTIEETLTLESVKELHLKNTKAIGLLDLENKWTSRTNFGLSTFIILFIIMILVKKRHQNRSEEIVTTIPAVHLTLPEVATTNFMAPPKPPRLSQIPYF